ncbi:MAG TPA: SDR family NAD(P)-dependent oxidoreductase [Candidatus Norongarragalinales archaeon]|nr:SDR family NAD(P)-dependent oxidoreductase [Candidatus Norongarragalinales archaeon]
MRILVTGGCGFIGSHVVDELTSRGHEVEVLSRPNCNLSNIREHKSIVHHNADISDREKVFAEIGKGLDGIIHMSALVNVDQSRNEPLRFLDVNVGGTVNVMEAARQKGIPRYLHMSTCEVYGNIPSGKATEEQPLNPRSPYAVSKFAAERYVLAYAHTYPEMGIRMVRGFNQYGPRQSAEKFGAVIPKFITQALKGERMKVFGGGEQTRDYVFAKDTARGISDAFENTTLANGEIINLATGLDYSIMQIAVRIAELTGKAPKEAIEHVDGRPGELMRSIGDSSKAKALLGWVPTVKFDEGLKITYDWFRAQMK